MKRRLTAMVAACCLAMQLPVFAGDIVPSGASVYLNGEQLTFDVPPMNQDGRTLVPMRAVLEALGATVDWDGAAQRVTAQKDAIAIDLIIGSQTAYVNGQAVELDVPAVVYNDRTLVPLRFVSEKLGLDVQYNGEKNRITIVGSTQSVTRGVLTSDSGIKYVGEIVDGLPDGNGKIYDVNATLRYDGSFKNGEQEGLGKEYRKDGSLLYDGNFLNSQYHGNGDLYYKNGDLCYSGEWENGLQNGQGVMYINDVPCIGTFINGNYYFEDGSYSHFIFEDGDFTRESINSNGKKTSSDDTAATYVRALLDRIDTYRPKMIAEQEKRAKSYANAVKSGYRLEEKLESIDDVYYFEVGKLEMALQDSIEYLTSQYYKVYGEQYDPTRILDEEGFYFDKSGNLRVKEFVAPDAMIDYDAEAAYERELRQINDYYDEQIEALETAQKAMSSSVMRDTMGAIQSANGGYMNSAAAIAAAQAGMQTGSYYADKIAALEDVREREIADLKARYGIR